MKNFYTLTIIYPNKRQEVITRSYNIDTIAIVINSLYSWQHIVVFTSNGRNVTNWAKMKSKVIKGN
jgi:hypothetical protein